MSLTQRLYLFSVAGFGLLIIVFSILFWSWNALNITMEKVDYTQRVGEVVDQLQLNIFTRQVALSHKSSTTWLASQKRFTEVIDSSPLLTPQQQTLQNSIISQNGSLMILFKQIQQLSDQFPHSKIESHLNARLLTQIELIREDCLQLVSNAESSLRNVMSKLFYILAFILVSAVCGLTWGGISITRVFKSSIKEIQYGIDDILHGNYKKINLSEKSTEFSEFVEKFNAMSKQLAETTVSRDSLQTLIDGRTAALQIISNTDSLTNIANRRALFERGKVEFARTKRYPFKLALLMIDCDFFKKINDNYGHATGDQVLQHLCRTFEKAIRDVDFLARYGGEEFVVILPHCEEAGAIETAKRIQLALKNTPLLIDDLNLDVKVSIGIVINEGTHTTFEALLNDADKALLIAKNNGRNRFEIAQSSLNIK